MCTSDPPAPYLREVIVGDDIFDFLKFHKVTYYIMNDGIRYKKIDGSVPYEEVKAMYEKGEKEFYATKVTYNDLERKSMRFTNQQDYIKHLETFENPSEVVKTFIKDYYAKQFAKEHPYKKKYLDFKKKLKKLFN